MNINYLAQPQTSVSHGLTIFVTVPRQKEHLLQQLDNLGLNIGLLLFREGEEAVARIPMPYKTTEGKLSLYSDARLTQPNIEHLFK